MPNIARIDAFTDELTAIRWDFRVHPEIEFRERGTSDIVAQVARDVVGADNVSTIPKPKTGSEDFADLLCAVPGAYFWLGHTGSVPVYNPGFILDDGLLPVGAKA